MGIDFEITVRGESSRLRVLAPYSSHLLPMARELFPLLLVLSLANKLIKYR